MAPLSLLPKNFTVGQVVNAHFMNASLVLVCWSRFVSESYPWQPTAAILPSFLASG
jgi:hypothetical protein